jgi:hypothetical protein
MTGRSVCLIVCLSVLLSVYTVSRPKCHAHSLKRVLDQQAGDGRALGYYFNTRQSERNREHFTNKAGAFHSYPRTDRAVCSAGGYGFTPQFVQDLVKLQIV